ncbi:MAG: radical SAM protein [Methanobacteriota archaeon]
MKVIYVIPPKFKGKIPERIYGCSYTLYPIPNLAILYSAAVLEKAGHNIKIMDACADNISQEEFIKILEGDCDYYIFHSVLLSAEVDKKAAAEIIKLKSDASIIFFGPHPTYAPKEFLLNENCVVARGEAEFIIEEIAGGKEQSKIKGISFLENGKVKNNETAGVIEDINKIPFPARHLLEAKKYFNPKLGSEKFTNVLSGRGCAYKCYFCVPNSISWARGLEWKKYNDGKPSVTLRSAENVVEEVTSLANEGYEQISFIDDQFVWKKERVLKICEGIKNLKINFGILARADYLTDEAVVKALAEAGCKYVDIGAESFNQEILNDVHKNLNIGDVYKAINVLNKYKITPKLNIMFGSSPLESKDTIKQTIEETKRLDIGYVMFSICTPFPGTEFEKAARENRWLVEDNAYNLDPARKALVSYPALSSSELEEYVRKANREFYLRPKIIKLHLKKIGSIAELMQNIKTALRLLR